jgi:hypothetical protein
MDAQLLLGSHLIIIAYLGKIYVNVIFLTGTF